MEIDLPHLQIQYSNNLNRDMATFCALLSDGINSLGLYPLGGVRVRAFESEHYAIADQDPRNAFCDLVFRIGKGRGDLEKKKTGQILMGLAEDFFSEELESGYFMLSLEIVEINPEFSWKTNSVHSRLRKESDDSA